MNRFIVSTILIIAFTASAAESVPPARLASGKSALNVPFKIFNNHIYLQVSVNNSKPLWFLLDTGAGNIINHRHAQPLGLKLTKAGQTIGVGEGTADFFWANKVSFNLAGITVKDQKFAVISLENVEDCLTKLDVDSTGQITTRTQARDKGEHPIDGVLGFEFFKLFVVEIDYVAQAINLHDPESYRYEGEGERIPFEIRGNHIFAQAQITAGAQSALPGLFLIDSGSAVGVVLN